MGESRSLTARGTIGISPTAQIGVSFGETSTSERNQGQWKIVPRTVMDFTKGNESESIFWRYTCNDAYKSEHRQAWSFPRELLPSALYGFSRSSREPALEIEIMVFWSEPEDSGRQRGFFPFDSRATEKASSAIFANFIYQVSVKVDLNDIQADQSYTAGGTTADRPSRDDLCAAKQGTVHLDPVKTFAESDSGTGSTAHKPCEVVLQRAIEGRITLTKRETSK